MTLRIRAFRAPPEGLRGALRPDQARRLLPGRALHGEVRQRLRELLAAPGHRLSPEPAGPVRRAHERPRHDTREADLVGLLAQLDELLRPHPALDRAVQRD